MKIKIYKVYPKNQPDLWYYIYAPSKRVAKWCGAAVLSTTYFESLTAKDMAAERCKFED